MSDDSIVILSNVLNWDILIKTHPYLSERILLLYVNKYFNWSKIFKYQKFSDNILRLYLDKLSPKGNSIRIKVDLITIIYYRNLTSVIFKEYIHLFEKDEIFQIISLKYDKKFLLETIEVIDWKKWSNEYFNKYPHDTRSKKKEDIEWIKDALKLF